MENSILPIFLGLITILIIGLYVLLVYAWIAIQKIEVLPKIKEVIVQQKRKPIEQTEVGQKATVYIPNKDPLRVLKEGGNDWHG